MSVDAVAEGSEGVAELDNLELDEEEGVMMNGRTVTTMRNKREGIHHKPYTPPENYEPPFLKSRCLKIKVKGEKNGTIDFSTHGAVKDGTSHGTVDVDIEKKTPGGSTFTFNAGASVQKDPYGNVSTEGHWRTKWSTDF